VPNQERDEEIKRYGDLEIENSPTSKKVHHVLQQIGRALGALIIIGTLLGAFGGGPLSGTKIQGKEWLLEYEKMGLQNTPLTYHLTLKEIIQGEKIQIKLQYRAYKALSFQRTSPVASRTLLDENFIIFEFETSSIKGKKRISLLFKPEDIGFFRPKLSIADEVIEIQQVILP
jgi:hypothetical protein